MTEKNPKDRIDINIIYFELQEISHDIFEGEFY